MPYQHKAIRHPKPKWPDFYEREQTYKNYDLAKRAFYKWVCKEGLFGKLYIEGYWRGDPYYRRRQGPDYGGYGYVHGYPIFGWHRSNAMDYWQIPFKEHRDKAKAEESKRLEEEYACRYRAFLMKKKHTKTFFQMLGAGISIK